MSFEWEGGMFLVFDVGATVSRIALADDRKLHRVERFPTDRSSDGIDRLVERLKMVAEGQTITGVAGGVAGQVNTAGAFEVGTNLPAWRGHPLRRPIAAEFDCPVWIFNDVAMTGIGEAHLGAGVAKGVMSYVTVSTGVNAARLVDGRPDDSISRFELGYQIVSGGPKQASSLGELISGAALEQRRGVPPAEIHEPELWIQEAIYLARGLYNMQLYWAPEVIVLGGSMMRDIHMAVIEEQLRGLPHVSLHRATLRRAELGDRGGLEGARILLSKLETLA
jgi:predicted NBD/HSP70 family sugar kinase